MAAVFATFPGVVSMEAAYYALGHGITPGTGTIEFAPQPLPPAREGTLILSDGITGLAVPGCVLDSASVVRDGAGFVVACQVIDRRWRWRFGAIYGTYNVRDRENEIIPETQKTPQELAVLLLEAMGEAGVNVSALPLEPLPAVEWDGDNPAQELAELCDLTGCRIGLDVTGACRIWKYGVGAPAPAGPVERRGGDLDPPEPPDRIDVLFAPTLVQSRLTLEAVGRDTDGTVKLIDDLSYKPAGGWDAEDDLFPGVTDQTARVYCLQSVYRWYRVTLPAGGLTVPGFDDPITELSQILPLAGSLVETWVDPGDLERKPRPIKVYGTYWIRNAGTPKNSSKDDNWECPVRFRLLPDLGVLAFEEPVKRFVAGGDPTDFRFRPAELRADVAFGVQDDRRAYHRYRFSGPTGSQGGTGPEIVNAQGEGGIKVYKFFSQPTQEDGDWNHAAKGSPEHLNAVGQKYFDAALRKWTVARGESITYSGIQAVPIDGLNVMASFAVDQGGASTQLSRSREGDPDVPAYNVRREREKWSRMASRFRRSMGADWAKSVRPAGRYEGER